MKKSILKKTTIASLIAITLTSIGLGATSAKASTVATVTAPTSVRLYTSDGQLVQNRGLAPNTPWAVGKIITLAGTTYYQVATNEYLKASDSKLSGDAVNNVVTGTIVNGDAPIYYTTMKGDAPIARTLANGSQWSVDSAILDSNGNTYYEVAPNQWISAKNMTVNGTVNTWHNNVPFDGVLGLSNNDNNNTSNNNNNNNNQSEQLSATVINGDATVYSTATKGDPFKATTLPEGSSWAVDRVVKGKDGVVYYEVALGQYITGDHVQTNKTPDNIENYPAFVAYPGI